MGQVKGCLVPSSEASSNTGKLHKVEAIQRTGPKADAVTLMQCMVCGIKHALLPGHTRASIIPAVLL